MSVGGGTELDLVLLVRGQALSNSVQARLEDSCRDWVTDFLHLGEAGVSIRRGGGGAATETPGKSNRLPVLWAAVLGVR